MITFLALGEEKKAPGRARGVANSRGVCGVCGQGQLLEGRMSEHQSVEEQTAGVISAAWRKGGQNDTTFTPHAAGLFVVITLGILGAKPHRRVAAWERATDPPKGAPAFGGRAGGLCTDTATFQKHL